MKNAAPIIAAMLLLLPVPYVGSYLALVTPNGSTWGGGNYRCCPEVCSTMYWPLEQADRKIRPNAWAQWRR